MVCHRLTAMATPVLPSQMPPFSIINQGSMHRKRALFNNRIGMVHTLSAMIFSIFMDFLFIMVFKDKANKNNGNL